MLLREAAPDFDDPLGLLRACHVKILSHSGLLVQLCQHVQTRIDNDARQAAAKIHRYFSTAGQLHHQDEEIDLFPLLQGNSQAEELIRQLKQEHEALGQLWTAFEPILSDDKRLAELAAMSNQAETLQQLYSQHIATENSELLPLAETLLDKVQLQQLGECMRARRKV